MGNFRLKIKISRQAVAITYSDADGKQLVNEARAN